MDFKTGNEETRRGDYTNEGVVKVKGRSDAPMRFSLATACFIAAYTVESSLGHDVL